MLKKLWANRVGVLVLVMCAYLLVFGIVKSAEEPISAVPAYTDPRLPVIILDAGHGGIDSGCTSVNGVYEKDINLSIMLKLRDMLEMAGFETVTTRETDKSIHDLGVTGIGNQKKTDMENRLEIVNSRENAIFVSIHQNQFTDSKYYGAQMFYPGTSAESEHLATLLQRSITSKLQPENKRETKPVGSEIYLLNNANCPAVMAECGFLSNPEESANLESEQYQSQIAFALFTGICEYVFEGQNT